ncbi:MAG: nucleotidyltransferase family protein [Selenomonadaceae bacterium]|nr:nucleotidyltransferase family protein [Selenomonadaceae bacterium]
MRKVHTVGIIAEYNPFHCGHAYQLAAVRERFPEARRIAAMSGSIVQRGTPAICDKWTRAEMAVRSGADLVLELPFVFACRSAQDFARGGVSLLAQAGCDALAFGAECQDLGLLQAIAQRIDTPAFQAQLHETIAAGASYPAALTGILQRDYGADRAVLTAPNNILALEYLRALAHHPEIRPVLIPREGQAHGETALPDPSRAGRASASAIRHALFSAEDAGNEPDWNALRAFLPAGGCDRLRQTFAGGLPRLDRLFRTLKLQLTLRSDEALRGIYGLSAGDGLLGRLRKAATKATAMEDFVHCAASRPYPASRIRRQILYLLLGVTSHRVQAMDAAGPRYARVLAFRQTGRALLQEIVARGSLPVLTKTSQFLTTKKRQQDVLTLSEQMLALDTEATELRALTMPSMDAQPNDFNTSPRVVSSAPELSQTENF